MSAVSETLSERRHIKAENEHLRDFYLLWCDMHMTCGSTVAHLADKQRSAQSLVDKAKVLKEFYS